MMLKAACINNAGYIDRLITVFMKVTFIQLNFALATTFNGG